jgi:hypothetical protein
VRVNLGSPGGLKDERGTEPPGRVQDVLAQAGIVGLDDVRGAVGTRQLRARRILADRDDLARARASVAR